MARNFSKKKAVWGSSLLAVLSLFCFPMAHGAEFPTKTIQIVNPNAPGGPADVASRMLTPRLSAIFGQSVVVVSKTGGGATIGIQAVADGAPDGYTLLFTGPTIITAPLMSKVPFSLKDFVPINLTVEMPKVLLVKGDSPWRTLEDLISYAKKNPGKLNCSTGGAGHFSFFDLERLKRATGTDITHVPMEGAAQATVALVGGHVDMNFMALQGAKSYMESGALRALMTLSRTRVKELPDIPTMVEKGYSKFISTTWLAFFAPAKTPPGVVKRLGDVFNQALRDKELVAMLEKAGAAPVSNLGPEEAARYLNEEDQELAEIVKAGRLGKK